MMIMVRRSPMQSLRCPRDQRLRGGGTTAVGVENGRVARPHCQMQVCDPLDLASFKINCTDALDVPESCQGEKSGGRLTSGRHPSGWSRAVRTIRGDRERTFLQLADGALVHDDARQP